MPFITFRRTIVLALMAAVAAGSVSAGEPLSSERREAREIFKELIEFRTVAGVADTTTNAANAMAERLTAAGFPDRDVQVLSHEAGLGMLVARYRGDGRANKKPILLMAHLDVVDALKEDWSLDPFKFTERDGYFYGRGTGDNKGGAAALVATFLRFKAEGYVPDRDLIMVLTADEETTAGSIKWLLKKKRKLVDSEYALNTDSGGGARRGDTPISFSVQASEKTYITFIARFRNAGGHSSVPVADNAIYHLAAALGRLSAHRFPAKMNEVTRAFFAEQAKLSEGDISEAMADVAGPNPTREAFDLLSEDTYFNALLRTTCVATMLKGGHAENALPQMAQATINCRMLPDSDAQGIEATLREVLDDPALELEVSYPPTFGPSSPLRDDVLAAVRLAVDVRYPGLAIVPDMSTGATDGLYVRNAGIPTYGVAGLFGDIDDGRAHGRDERVGVEDFYAAVEHWQILLKALTGGEGE
jgi:acetylornithine deacetylase/succinyl-diaminopimelate desuccinylase-like protein